MIAIVDYQMGNVGSVKNALDYLKIPAKISRDPVDLSSASHIILPGVGAYGEGMKKLNELGIIQLLEREVRENKKPFLGICLGMQLLTDVGEELGTHNGLGWIPGRTRKFSVDETAYPVPHIGWNDVVPEKGAALFSGTEPNVFYFVHSYVVEPSDASVRAASTVYGETFTAAVQRENVYGVQFHPERSQKSGLKILQNFYGIAHA